MTQSGVRGCWRSGTYRGIEAGTCRHPGCIPPLTALCTQGDTCPTTPTPRWKNGWKTDRNNRQTQTQTRLRCLKMINPKLYTGRRTYEVATFSLLFDHGMGADRLNQRYSINNQNTMTGNGFTQTLVALIVSCVERSLGVIPCLVLYVLCYCMCTCSSDRRDAHVETAPVCVFQCCRGRWTSGPGGTRNGSGSRTTPRDMSERNATQGNAWGATCKGKEKRRKMTHSRASVHG